MSKSPENGTTLDDDNGTDSNLQSTVKAEEILVFAIASKIYGLRKRDGTRIWKADAPTGNKSVRLSMFVTDDNQLVVGGAGRTACMNLYTGQTKWLNKMPGFGKEEVGLVATSSHSLLHQTQNLPSNNETQEEAPPRYTEAVSSKGSSVVISCTRGKCMAIDLATGEQLWIFDCPKGGLSAPVAIIEPVSVEAGRTDQRVYIGCGKWIYCLQAKTGVLEWSRSVSNTSISMFGGYATLATAWSSRFAAESHTPFSQFPKLKHSV